MDDPKAVAPWQRFGVRDLRRAGLWGLAALAASSLAVFTATSDIGRNRLALTVTKTQVAAPAKPAEDAAIRRLADIVQSLAIDYDRQTTRLDALERNVGEITGSIGRLAAAQPATQPPPIAQPAYQPPPTPPPVIAPPEVTPPVAPSDVTPAEAPEVTSIIASQSPPTTPTAPGRRQFGIDLGGAANVDGLRALWATAKSKHGSLLLGLHPVVAIRDNARPAGTQFRLVVGPLGDASSAARLCSVIVRSDALCHPAKFEGQRLGWP